MFAPPPHTSAASVITTPHSSVRDPANSTGGAYSRLILIAPNADPQNNTSSANARISTRRSASNGRPPKTPSPATDEPGKINTRFAQELPRRVLLGNSDGMNSALAKKKGQSYAARTSACSTITVTKSGEPVLSGKTVSQACASVSVEGNVNT